MGRKLLSSVQYSINSTTVFDLIGARGAYINLFSTTSAKKIVKWAIISENKVKSQEKDCQVGDNK